MKSVIERMKGKIVKNIFINSESILNIDDYKYCDDIYFLLDNNDVIRMHHEKDCCEIVYLEDVIGNMKDLIDSEILIAEESSSEYYDSTDESKCWKDHTTWTFYKFATRKGYITLRWYGSSNGAYSEKVDIDYIEAKEFYDCDKYNLFKDKEI